MKIAFPEAAKKSGSVGSSSISNDIFYRIAENASDMIIHFKVRPEVSLVYISPSSTRIIGYTPEEIYADSNIIKNLVHPDDNALFNNFMHSNNGGNYRPVVLRWIHKNGSTIWTEQTKAVIKNDHSEVTDSYFICRDITDHKLAEIALQESQKFNASLLDNAPHAIMVINPDTSVSYVNPAWERLNGWTLAEVAGLKAPYPWWPDEVRNAFMEGFAESLKQDSGKGEIISRKKNGEIYWIDMNWTAVKHNGERLYLLINSVDITERKRTEEAVKDLSARQEAILSAVPDIIMEIDTNKVYTWANRAGIEFFGDDVIGKRPDYYFEGKQDTYKRIQPLFNGYEDIIYVESWQRRKDGKKRLLAWWCRAMKDDKDNVTGVLSSARDITESRQMEDALSREAIRRRILIEQSSDGIVSLDQNGKVHEANRRFAEMLGYSPGEVLDLHVWDWDIRWTKEKLLEMINTATDAGNRFVTRNKRKDGTIFDVEISTNGAIISGKKFVFCVCRDITEHNRAEQALRESEEKFSKAFTSSPNAICIFTIENGQFIEVNDSFIRFSGYSREEIIGHTQDQLDLWADSADLEKMGKILRETGRLNNEEVKSRMKSGEIRTGLFSAETIEIGGKKCIILEITDITEQVEAKKALRESEEKFSVAFLASPDMMSIIDIQDGKYIEVNDSFVTLSGYSREELIGHTVEEVGLFVNHEEMDRIRLMTQKSGKIRHAEVQIRTKSGMYRTWMVSSDIIKVGGKPCSLAVASDITIRKQAEKALRESEEKFATAFNSSPDMMFITSSDGRYMEVNESFTRISGYTREEVLGRKTTEFNTWVDAVDRDKILKKIKNHGRIHNEECQFRVKSGDIHTILFSTEVINIAGERCTISVGTDITERIKVEKALRESEEKFSLAFNSSPDMMIITEFKEGKYVEVNDSFVRNTGYSREELFSRKVAELNLWAKQEQAEKMIQLMQKQGKIRNEEYDFRTKSGEIHTWLCSADIVTIGGEQMMLAVASDITEQKKSREALRESQEKFSKAFHSSPFSISIIRLSDGNFIEVNEAFLRDKGYTREELIGRSSKEFDIWADPQEGIRLMETLRAGGKIVNEEFRFRTKNGNIRTGLVSSEVISIGNEPCMLVMNNDITQQKQAAEQLRLLSSVTQQVSDSTIITDHKFNITYMNRAAQELLGYTLDEVRGKNLAMFNATHSTNRVRRSVKNTVSSGGVYSDIISKKRKDGTTIICDCRLSPLYDENGIIHSYIDVERDVTRQKEVEQKLQEHKNLIDSILATMPEGVLVIDNTDRIVLANKAFQNIFHTGKKALKEKLLQQILPVDQFFNLHKTIKTKNEENVTLEFRYKVQNTEKIIFCIIVKMDGELTLLTFSDVSGEREEEEKLYLTDRLASLGEMAAGLAHELNNPLTGILALSQLLTTSDIPDEYQEDIKCIHEEAKRAANIVKNVLLFARNNPGESGSSSVNNVITNVLRLREYEQKANNIKVVTHLEDQLPNVPIDNGQLQQVFLNIISNAEAAIKETNRPGLIMVNSERVNNHVNIIFKDNGCGIKKNILPRIFDPFFTTKEIGKGTGLGLSICYSIIVKHGGKINVSSQINEGAAFTIKMPVVQ